MCSFDSILVCELKAIPCPASNKNCPAKLQVVNGSAAGVSPTTNPLTDRENIPPPISTLAIPHERTLATFRYPTYSTPHANTSHNMSSPTCAQLEFGQPIPPHLFYAMHPQPYPNSHNMSQHNHFPSTN